MKRLITITLVVIVASALVFLLRGSNDKVGSDSTPAQQSGWITATSSAGVSFQYPEDLGITYVSLVDWPPQVQILDEEYQCSEAGAETARAGRTEERSASGQEFCVTTVAEGAAGSIYRQYAYIFPYEEQSLSFTFSLRFPQCANFSQPEQDECQSEQEGFEPDALIQEIFASISTL